MVVSFFWRVWWCNSGSKCVNSYIRWHIFSAAFLYRSGSTEPSCGPLQAALTILVFPFIQCFYKIQDKIAVPRIMVIIPNSLWVWFDIESKYQSISLSYKLLGLENASTPSTRDMSPINLMTQGKRHTDADNKNSTPAANGKMERILRSIPLTMLLITSLVSSV